MSALPERLPYVKKLLLGAVAAFLLLLGTPAAAGASTAPVITLLHGIPGATVDVYVNGAVVIPGFAPGTTQDLSGFAGSTLTNVEVKLAGTDTVVIGPIASLPVPSSGNWTVVAHLDASGNAVLTPFANDTTPVASGSGRLIVRHTAAAPAVDLVVGAARPITNLANGQEQALVLPAGVIAGAQLAPTGGDPIVDVPSVTLVAGTALIVYAVGSLEAQTFTFLTQTVPLGELPQTGAGDVAVKAGLGLLMGLAGVGLVVAARRRPAAA
jgi:hypothetical protein